jgi:hypothetical protein
VEERVEKVQKLCEIEGVEDFNCIDCPEFDTCQMILYDSLDETGDLESKDESGLRIV